MARLKIKRILGRNKPLRGIIDVVTQLHPGVFSVESPDGVVLLGSRPEDGVFTDILVKGECIGRVCAAQGDRAAVEVIERTIAIEMEKRDLAAEVLDRYRELNLLYDLAEKLTECHDIPGIGRLVLDEANKVAPSVWGRIYLIDELARTVVASLGETGRLTDIPLLERIVETGRGEVLDDLGEGHPIRSWIAVPIKSRVGSLGVLILGAAVPQAYNSGTLKLVTSLAGQAAPAIESARLTEHQRDLARSFARFVPDEFLGALQHRSVTEVDTGDHAEKHMSVFFSDIRSFTTLVEGKEPDESYRFINEYLSHMEPGIRSHSGFVAEVVGDAIMALFDDGGADNAVRAAIACQRALQDYNRTRHEAGELPVVSGIGISSGPLMLGTIGSPERIKCGVIGDAVNTAARVEGLTKIYGAQILITHHTRDQLVDKDAYLMRPVDRVRAKGKSLPVVLYEVLDAYVEDEKALRLAAQSAYLRGWSLYQDARPSEALGAFADAMRLDPSDRLSRLYLGRCWQLLEYGVPQGWDGIADMRIK